MKNHYFRLFIYRVIILLTFSFTTVGCADLTQAGFTQLDNSILYQDNCIHNEGHVFAIRGFLGIWSRGMNTISWRAKNEFHIPSTTIGSIEESRLANFIIRSYKEGCLHPPIILVGHSLGSDDIISIAWKLYYENIPIALLAMTDPVMPRPIPPNVLHCYNLYKPHPLTDCIPIYRGVRVYAIDPSRTYVENVDVRKLSFDNDRITHFNIDVVRPIQDLLLSEIRKTVQLYRAFNRCNCNFVVR